MNSREMKSSWILKKCSEVLHGTGTWHLKIWWTQEDVKIIWCLNCIQTGSSFNDFFKSLGRLSISSIFLRAIFSYDHMIHIKCEVNGPQSARSFNWNWPVRKKYFLAQSTRFDMNSQIKYCCFLWQKRTVYFPFLISNFQCSSLLFQIWFKRPWTFKVIEF